MPTNEAPIFNLVEKENPIHFPSRTVKALLNDELLSFIDIIVNCATLITLGCENETETIW